MEAMGSPAQFEWDNALNPVVLLQSDCFRVERRKRQWGLVCVAALRILAAEIGAPPFLWALLTEKELSFDIHSPEDSEVEKDRIFTSFVNLRSTIERHLNRPQRRLMDACSQVLWLHTHLSHSLPIRFIMNKDYPGMDPVLADAIRDIYRNPYRPAIVIEPEEIEKWITWNNGIINKIAIAIYETGKFDNVLILADAVEDAGCGNIEIISHLRNGLPHYRGCWVVDYFLFASKYLWFSEE